MRLRVCTVILGLGVVFAACAARPLPTQRQPEDGAKAETRFLSFAILAAAAQGDEAKLAAYLDPACREWPNGTAAEVAARPCRAWLAERLAPRPGGADAVRGLAEDPGARCYAAYETKAAQELGLPLADWKRRVGPKGLVWVFPVAGKGPLVLAFAPCAAGWVLKGGY